MFSKVISRVGQYQSLNSIQSRAFRASAIANNKSTSKPSIGDAVTILQSKVSGINQVVSKRAEAQLQPASIFVLFANHKRLAARFLIYGRPALGRRFHALWLTLIPVCVRRTTSRSSDPSSPLVMVSPESSVSPRCRLVRWSSSSREPRVWLSTWKLTTLVLSSLVTTGKSQRSLPQHNWFSHQSLQVI